MDGSLVELVEDDRREVAEERILLQARGEDPFRREEDLRLRAELPLEPNVPADLAADRPVALECDPLREAARRDAARLQDDHRPVGGERWRDARGLACAGRGGHDDRARATDRVENRGKEAIDRKDHGTALGSRLWALG